MEVLSGKKFVFPENFKTQTFLSLPLMYLIDSARVDKKHPEDIEINSLLK